MGRFRRVFAPGGQARELASRGLSAFLIKVSSAALAPLSFIALARVLDPTEYGVFAFGFSLATFLAIVSTFGQPTLALRLLPVFRDRDQPSEARGAILFGYAVVIASSVLIGAVALAVIYLATGSISLSMLAAVSLVLPLAIADFQSGYLRGMGLMGRALIPADIVWRLLIAGICLPTLLLAVSFPFAGAFTANVALISVTVLLVVVVIGQLVSVPHVCRLVLSGPSPTYDGRAWLRSSVGLCANVTLQRGAQHLAIVLAGLVLAPMTTAGLFAAIKVALSLNFFLIAGNLAAAPTQSRLWYAGKKREMRRVSAFVTLSATIPAALAFTVLAAAGRPILELFGPHYSDYYVALLILAGSQVVNSACGQTAFVMNMTGNERVLTRQVLWATIVPLGSIPILCPYLGVNYAAFAIALALTLWNLQAALWARRNLGVDSTIFGVREALRDRPAPGPEDSSPEASHQQLEAAPRDQSSKSDQN